MAATTVVEVKLTDVDEVVTLVDKFTTLLDALRVMKMTCHNCGEPQTLSLGVQEAIAAIKDKK